MIKTNREISLPAPQQFIAPESHVSLKDRREARSLQNVPLASHHEVVSLLIDNNFFVWSLLRMQCAREEEDCDLIRATTWNQFHEHLCETIIPPTVIGYGPLFPQPPTDPSVVQASVDYFMALTDSR